MSIKKVWQLIVLLIILGVLFQAFVDTVRELMPYILGGAVALGILSGLFMLGRYIYYRSRQF